MCIEIRGGIGMGSRLVVGASMARGFDRWIGRAGYVLPRVVRVVVRWIVRKVEILL